MSLIVKARLNRIAALEEIANSPRTPRPEINLLPVDFTAARIAADKRLNKVRPRRVTSRPVTFIHTPHARMSLAA